MGNTAARLRLVLHQSFSLANGFSNADPLDRYSRVQVSCARQTGHDDNYSIYTRVYCTIRSFVRLLLRSHFRVCAGSRSRSIGIIWISAKRCFGQSRSINRVNRKLPLLLRRRSRILSFSSEEAFGKTLRRSTMPTHSPYWMVFYFIFPR